jgi:hypothetical protein
VCLRLARLAPSSDRQGDSLHNLVHLSPLLINLQGQYSQEWRYSDAVLIYFLLWLDFPVNPKAYLVINITHNTPKSFVLSSFSTFVLELVAAAAAGLVGEERNRCGCYSY